MGQSEQIGLRAAAITKDRLGGLYMENIRLVAENAVLKEELSAARSELKAKNEKAAVDDKQPGAQKGKTNQQGV